MKVYKFSTRWNINTCSFHTSRKYVIEPNQCILNAILLMVMLLNLSYKVVVTFGLGLGNFILIYCNRLGKVSTCRFRRY